MRIGSAIRSFGIKPGGHCGIYGSNCPEWVMAMQACNSRGICYVPLYDTLGPNAVEFILDHAEISIAFVQESKIKSVSQNIDPPLNSLK
ncbi:probable CoA ligase CCL6 [Phragmites australis]|uniref:probable CoA ligase CCL6 n=1 Tax=Phragmites australis TaxID=29695 RepID=UPI002D77321C|nr:probable CoA ligase CCL6 [Phragmites australis]